MRVHQSENLALMGTMRPLVKHIMTVIVIAKKSRTQWKMCVLRGKQTNMLHPQVEKLSEGISMLGVTNASENIHSGINQDLGLL